MEILVDITSTSDGRLNGTLRPVDGTARLQFSGRMELLARLEELCRTGAISDIPPDQEVASGRERRDPDSGEGRP